MANKIRVNNSTTLFPYMDNLYKVDKLFLSAVIEEEWLNLMASNGFVLKLRMITGYVFEVDKQAGDYYYSVGVFSVPVESESASEAISTRTVTENAPFYTYGNKAYYKTKIKDTGITKGVVDDATSKRRHLRNVFAFNFSLLCFWLGLLCYNLIYWVRFDSAGVLDTEKTNMLWRFTIDMSSLFGDYPTTPYISLFIVLSLISIPFTIYFLDQYLYSRRFEKAIQQKWVKK